MAIVEDRRHAMMTYRYLMQCPTMRRDAIRILSSPSGIGSAERWVLERFATEVRICRTRQPKTLLLAVIDADTDTVQHRLKQLDDALIESGQMKIDAMSERIARLVPRRNIETWVLCLNGESIGEKANYKQEMRYSDDQWNGKIRRAALVLFQWTRQVDRLPDHCPLSLRSGVEELKRLKL